jgi:hypothetical protein
MYRYLVHAALLGFAAIGFGCAPTQLGDRELKGSKPLLSEETEYGSAVFKSSGENLAVTITIPPNNDTCVGQFKLVSSKSSYLVIPGGPNLIYSGAFQSDLSSKCLALIGHPGGTQMALVVAQGVFGDRANISICESSAQMGDGCFGKAVIYSTEIED